jgi:hypothetical protein
MDTAFRIPGPYENARFSHTRTVLGIPGAVPKVLSL